MNARPGLCLARVVSMLLCMRISLSWPVWFVALVTLLPACESLEGGQLGLGPWSPPGQVVEPGAGVGVPVELEAGQEPGLCPGEVVNAMAGSYSVEVLGGGGCEDAPLPVSVDLMGKGIAAIYYTHPDGDTETIGRWFADAQGAWLESSVVAGWYHEPGLRIRTGQAATWDMERHDEAHHGAPPCVRNVRLVRQ